MGDEDSVDGTPVQLVEEGKSCHAAEGGVHSRVADDGSALVLYHTARATDL